MLSLATLQSAARGKVNETNATSLLIALNDYGQRYGLMLPHRLAQFLTQVMHESGEFRYDQEIWGPTPAQARYDQRTDLGNTPAQDGDGYKNRGRGPIQLTGGANIKAFYDWCLAQGLNPPNFVDNPDLINTDPWEGLSAVWYWEVGNPTRQSLNRYADTGDIEMITRRVNGGLNGYADRLELYTRISLVLLGYGPTDVRAFQQTAKAKGLYDGNIDGDAGPQTRSALHKALAAQSGATVSAAPVTQSEPVAPPQIDKPVTQTSGFWERITQLGGLTSIGGLAVFFQDWRVVLAITGGLIVVTSIGLVLHKQIIDAVKSIKQEIRS